MSAFFFLLWLIGGIPAAVLSEVVQSERPGLARAARVAFAVVLGIDLLAAAAAFAIGNSNPDSALRATRSIWWLTVIAGGIPLALVSGVAVRRGYCRHRVVLAVATTTTAALYVAFPFGFVPRGRRLRGLPRFEHEHHALDILVLVTPTLMLLASEVWRQRQVIAPASSGT